MNNYIEVDAYVDGLKAQGMIPQEIVWNLARACVEWPYVFGAAGALCTPSNRKARARADHPTIVSKCQVLNGKKNSCSGCKWFPGGVNVRQYDCRGFTRWCAAQVGVTIEGAGATSQWGKESNWAAKGTIDTIPQNQLVCLFVRKGSKMEHTGFGYNDETVECSSGVQYFAKRNKKWTHWAVPKGLEGAMPMPDYKPTLKRGSKGADVVELQNDLMQLDYALPKYGADGDFGKETENAVKKFQADHGLNADGICGPLTWDAIEAALDPAGDLITVHIPNLPMPQAQELVAQYPGAWISKE